MSIVTLDEVKGLGRIGYTDADALLTSLIDEAEDYVQKYCAIQLTPVTKVNERATATGTTIFPEYSPITAVTSVKDAFNSDTVIDATLYYFNNTQIVLDEGYLWGVGQGRWKISYTAGYTPITAPKGLRAPIRALVLLAYGNPEGKSSQSAGGYGTNWKSLADDNDITAVLDQFSFRRYVEL